jgi:hypothetical protein
VVVLYCITIIQYRCIEIVRLWLNRKPLSKHPFRVVFLLERLQFREAGSVYGGVRLVAECKVGIAVDLVNTSALSSRQ